MPVEFHSPCSSKWCKVEVICRKEDTTVYECISKEEMYGPEIEKDRCEACDSPKIMTSSISDMTWKSQLPHYHQFSIQLYHRTVNEFLLQKSPAVVLEIWLLWEVALCCIKPLIWFNLVQYCLHGWHWFCKITACISQTGEATDWTLGLLHAKQVLCHWMTIPPIGFFGTTVGDAIEPPMPNRIFPPTMLPAVPGAPWKASQESWETY